MSKQLALLSLEEIRRLSREIKKKGKVVTEECRLVTLKSGDLEPPLFLNHPAGAACYRELALRMNPGQVVYGLQEPTLEDLGEGYTPIKKTAESYIQTLKEVQPKGPYLLGGWSLGGLVAFEMGVQLQDQGERIELLVLIDTGVPVKRISDGHVSITAEEAGGALRAQLGDLLAVSGGDALSRRLSAYMGLTLNAPGDTSQSDLEEQERQLVSELQEKHVFSLDSGYLQRLARILRSHYLAAQNYVPQKCSQRILLLRCTEQHPYKDTDEIIEVRDEPTFGWQQYTTEPVIVHDVPGHHFSIMHKNKIGRVADILKRYLNNTSAQGEAS